MTNFRNLYIIAYAGYNPNPCSRNANKFIRHRSVWGLEEAKKLASTLPVLHVYNGVGEKVTLV